MAGFLTIYRKGRVNDTVQVCKPLSAALINMGVRRYYSSFLAQFQNAAAICLFEYCRALLYL